MSSSKLLRKALAGLVFLAPIALGACSGFTPVYGERGGVPSRLEFAYAEPSNRLAQIIIQDLALRLGRTDSPDAPEITISATSSAIALTRTNVVKPATQYEATVTASYLIVADGKTIASGSRRASASYMTSGQVLADEAAADDARNRAAHAVADTIRLAILGDLATSGRGAGTGL